jgi:hypothetical protein
MDLIFFSNAGTDVKMRNFYKLDCHQLGSTIISSIVAVQRLRDNVIALRTNFQEHNGNAYDDHRILWHQKYHTN